MTKPILNKAMNEITLLSALQVPDIKEDKSTEKLKRKWILAQEREEELAKVHQEGIDQGLTQEKVEEAKVNCIQLLKKYFPYTDTTFLENLTFTQYKLIFKALLEYQSLDEIQNLIS